MSLLPLKREVYWGPGNYKCVEWTFTRGCQREILEGREHQIAEAAYLEGMFAMQELMDSTHVED